jgi:hypothetical protein
MFKTSTVVTNLISTSFRKISGVFKFQIRPATDAAIRIRGIL